MDKKIFLPKILFSIQAFLWTILFVEQFQIDTIIRRGVPYWEDDPG